MERATEIRLGRPGDLTVVAELARSRAGGESSAWVNRLAEDLVVEDKGLWVADRAGEVVGYGRAHYFRSAPPPARTVPDGFYLIGLGILEQYRRRGLGLSLTKARLEWISVRASEAWYFTNARNAASLTLHAQLGFREVTRDFSFPGVSFEGGIGVLCSIDLAPSQSMLTKA